MTMGRYVFENVSPVESGMGILRFRPSAKLLANTLWVDTPSNINNCPLCWQKSNI